MKILREINGESGTISAPIFAVWHLAVCVCVCVCMCAKEVIVIVSDKAEKVFHF